MSDSERQTTSLPSFAACSIKLERGEPLSALERFVWDHEPAGEVEEARFREGLAAVIAEVSASDR